MNFQIFIAAKTLDAHGNRTRDSELARDVHDYLTSLGHTVFLGTLSLAKLGIDAYQKAIDDALDAAHLLIAVGTSADNLESRWVRYEWGGFLEDILSGVKPEGHLFTYADGIPRNRLPRGLRQRHVFFHGPDSLEELGKFVRNAMGRARSPTESCVAPRSSKTEAAVVTERVEIGVVAAGCTHVSDLKSAIDCANSSQRLFQYILLEDGLADAVRVLTFRHIDAPAFLTAIEKARLSTKSVRPFVIVVTDSSISGRTLSNLFGSQRAGKGLAVITTRQVPDIIIPADRMAAYFLYYLGRYTLSFLFPKLRTHRDTRSCVFDRKIRKTDLVQSMVGRALCDECRRQLLTEDGFGAATKIEALDHLFVLSGDILEKGPKNGKP